MNQEKVIVIDFGGQYNQLVARRVRECNVYCEIYSYKTPLEQIKAMNPKGIILTGGQTVVMKRVRLHAQRNYLNSECRYSDFVTGHSLCSMFLAERLKRHLYVSTERQRHLWIRAVLYLEMFRKDYRVDESFCYISQVAPEFKIIAQQQTVLSQLLSARKRISMQFSSTRKFFIHRKVQRCFIILYAACAVVLEHENGCIC